MIANETERWRKIIAAAGIKPLARYERERQDAGRLLVARGRRIGAHLEAARTPDDAGQRQRMKIVMRKYGAAGVIDTISACHLP